MKIEILNQDGTIHLKLEAKLPPIVIDALMGFIFDRLSSNDESILSLKVNVDDKPAGNIQMWLMKLAPEATNTFKQFKLINQVEDIIKSNN